MDAPDNEHSEDKSKARHELLQFIFNAHLSLFNTRREHEWRVIISAMVLMGAVDLTLVTQQIHLSESQQVLWCIALVLLFLSIWWYQWGVQVRNRVDRVAMDKVLVTICDLIKADPGSVIRAGIDREDERIPGSQIDYIMHRTYLWAFIPQMLVLLIATVLSGYLPYLTNGLEQSQECCPAACCMSCVPGRAATGTGGDGVAVAPVEERAAIALGCPAVRGWQQ